MFAGVATRYDLLNRLLSLRRDVVWRRQLVAAVAPAPPGPLLDLATGTGDVVFAVADRAVVGVDFTLPMLAIARRKAVARGRRDRWVVADCMALPFCDRAFAAVTVAFGVRNFADLDRSLGEMRRVLVTDGRLGILELHRPKSRVLATLTRIWNRLVVTPVGRLLSHDGGAYAYLPASIESFDDLGEVGQRLGVAGLELIASRELSGGIVGLTVGRRLEET